MFNFSAGEKLIIEQSNFGIFCELKLDEFKKCLQRFLFAYIGIKIIAEEFDFLHDGNRYELHEVAFDSENFEISDPIEKESPTVEISIFLEDMISDGNIVVFALAKLLALEKVEEIGNLVSRGALNNLELTAIPTYETQNTFELEQISNDRNPIAIPTHWGGSEIGINLWEEFGGYVSNRGELFDHIGVILNNLSSDIYSMIPKHNKFLVISPTGSGKTNVENQITRVLVQSKIVIVVSPFLGILYKNYDDYILDSKKIWDGSRHDQLEGNSNCVYFTTLKSLNNLVQYLEIFKRDYCVVFDEVHFLLNRYRYSLERFPDKLCIGFTGTDGRKRKLSDLGFHYSYVSEVTEGISKGYLADVEIFQYITRVSEATGNIISRLQELGALFDTEAISMLAKDELYVNSVVSAFKKHSLVYDDFGYVIGICPSLIEASSISQAENILFPLIQKLLPNSLKSKIGVFVSSKQKGKSTAKFLKRVKSGEIEVVIHVNMFGVGINIPRLEKIYMRPRIRSETGTAQAIGRVIRFFNGKLKTVIEIFPESSYAPEEMGFITAKQVFGISIIQNGLIFRGNVEQYDYLARKERLVKYFRKTTESYEPLDFVNPSVLLDSFKITKRKRSRTKLVELANLEGLEKYAYSCIITYQSIFQQSVYSYVHLQNQENNMPKIAQKIFEKLFGFQVNDCAVRFFGQNLTDAHKFFLDLSRIYPEILNPYLEIEKFSKFYELVQNNVTKLSEISEVKREISQFFGAVTLFDYSISWAKSGEISQDYIAQGDIRKIWEMLILEEFLQKFQLPFQFRKVDFKISPTKMLDLFEDDIVEYMKTEYLKTGGNLMLKSLPDNYFFQDFDDGAQKLFEILEHIYNSTKAIRYDSVRKPYFINSRTMLRDLHRKVLIKCRETCWLDETIEYDEIKETIKKRYLEGKYTITEMTDLPYTTLSILTSKIGSTPVNFINNAIAEVDADFRTSIEIYTGEVFEEFLNKISIWYKSQNRNLDISKLTSLNANLYLPLFCSVSKKSSSLKSLTRTQFRELAKKFGLTDAKFISVLRDALR